MQNIIISSGKFILALSALSILSFAGKAQDENLKKEVQVVRPYEPSISDAFKINLQPKIEDTIKVNPNFTYSILQRPINTNFAPSQISAARMLSEPLSDLYSTLIKVGVGTHTMPLVEAYYNSKRDQNFMYGGWAHFNSSMGKVKLDNDKKVDAENGNTNILFFGKRMFTDKILQGDLSYNNTKKEFYGYNTDDATLTPNSEKQKINRINANVEFNTTYKDSAHLNYSIASQFEHLADDFDMQENKVAASLSMNKYTKQEQFGGEVSLVHYMQNQALDSGNNTIFRLSPWIHLFGPQWRVIAGVGIIYDANSDINNTYFFPRGHMSYDVVSHYFIPYVEIGGFLEENSYSKILNENPWVIPGVDVWNTAHKLILTGGIKGKFSASVSYNILASYSIIDSMYFYVNTSSDITNPLMNKFSVDYDNVEQTKILGELTISPSEQFNILLHAEYYNYKMQNLQHPWQKPDYTAFINLRYSLRDKIVANVQLYSMGKRWVNEASPKQLDGFFDINLGLEYNYNKRISAFLNLNNITSSKYEEWYLYPTYRFNAQVGATYKF
ncbi:MAG: hypothetical protein AB7S48_15100 [Bacteroidales bacterium]